MDNNYQLEEVEPVIQQITKIAMASLNKKVKPETYLQLSKEELSDDVAWLFLQLYIIKELVDDSKATKALISSVMEKIYDEFKIRMQKYSNK